MSEAALVARIARAEATLRARPELRLRVCCPSQEFSRLEMDQGVGHWLSCGRGLWESLSVAAEPDLVLVMLQAPRIPPPVVGYLLRLRPGTAAGLRDRSGRHVLLDLDDASERHLSEKFLARPALLRRIRALVSSARRRGHDVAPLSCYQSSPRMDELAAALGLDVSETPSRTLALGSKAGSRSLFRAAGVPHPPGTYEAAHDLRAVTAHLAALAARHGPGRWLVKINEGCGSGHGNALVDLASADPADVAHRLAHHLTPCAAALPRAEFLRALTAHGAIVEKFLDRPPGGAARWPSALLLVGGDVHLLATHEQEIGREAELVGCRFPADPAYRAVIGGLARKVAARLLATGVQGHVGVDFLVHRAAGAASWTVHATEINLRQTGTTHPHRTVRALVPGTWHEDGRLTLNGAEVRYTATDHLISAAYRGITPAALIRRLDHRPDLSFDFRRGRGVIPHYWTALERFGRIGATFIDSSEQGCDALRERFAALLDGLSRHDRP